MDDQRSGKLRGECSLPLEHLELARSGGVVVVIVEAALSDGDRTGRHRRANRLAVADGIERVGMVGVYTGREIHESSMRVRNGARALRRWYRFADTKQSARTAEARAPNDVVPILIESHVRQVDVTVDEGRHPLYRDAAVPACSRRRPSARARAVPLLSPVVRGHLVSIHSRSAPEM